VQGAAGSAGLFIGLGPELGDDVTVRIVCLVCAAWMSLLVTWTVSGMPMRPGPPVPRGQNIVTASARRMLRALPRVWRSPQTTNLLGSYFIWSDGVSTLSGAAAVFASQELELGFSALIIAYLCTAVASLLSSLLFPWLAQRCGIAGKRILMANLLVMGLIPIYAIFALTSEPEFYVVTFLFGLMNGSAQVFAVSLYSAAAPSSSPCGRSRRRARHGSARSCYRSSRPTPRRTEPPMPASTSCTPDRRHGRARLLRPGARRAAASSAEDDDLEMRELTLQAPIHHGERPTIDIGKETRRLQHRWRREGFRVATHCERLALASASGVEHTTAGYKTEGLLLFSLMSRPCSRARTAQEELVMVGLVGYSRAQAWAAVVC
jgi:hypothetical protein